MDNYYYTKFKLEASELVQKSLKIIWYSQFSFERGKQVLNSSKIILGSNLSSLTDRFSPCIYEGKIFTVYVGERLKLTYYFKHRFSVLIL